ITGPRRRYDSRKINWDRFKLYRYGKALLESGYQLVPLMEIIYDKGAYMRLKVQ
ncbi:hypothetical protein BGZ65_012102, partial [Modicella reniformis]